MGFRKHRRHRGGGGGGGGGGGHAHDGRQYTGEANGLQPGDDVGNRKSFKPVIVPPEDIGNRRDPDEEEFVANEDVGNRIDASPTHEISGILLDLDPKKRRRGRPKGSAPLERVGRYLIGGVNPIIAGGNRPPPPPPPEGEFVEEVPQQYEQEQQQQQQRPPRQQQQPQRKRFEQVDGQAAQEVSERRAQRFFDFDEDDRFEYTLKTPAETKRLEAEKFVADIVREAGRDASVAARIIEDGDKPKLLVTIDDRGPAADLPAERRAGNAAEPLFVMGNAALMSLNYIVNKVVNRYPDDRIRLAVLPLADERLYLDSLDEHRRRAPVPVAPAASPPPPPAAPSAPQAEEAREQAIVAAVDVEPPAAVLNVDVPAPAPAPPAPAPVVELEEPAPKKSGRGRKPKKAEEIIPPPSALPVEPEPAKEEEKAKEANQPKEEEKPRRGRRPPAEDAPVLEEKKPLRPRTRRASTALVEVVRVGPKKS